MSQPGRQFYIFIFFIVLAVLSGCISGDKPDEIAIVPSYDTLDMVRNKAPVKLVPVKLGQTDSVSDYDLEDHLFGKFYGDRAGFYIITDPVNRILGHKVNSITLYYLDGKLYKTKYVVKDNLVNDLINMYPQFHIRGFDSRNRHILQSEGIYYRKRKKWYLNDNLSNYDIKWKVGRNRMRLRIDKSNKAEPFLYIVKNRNFDQALARIEYQE